MREASAVEAVAARGVALPPEAQCYLVGGAVRDALLGLPGADRDWVVVGSTAPAMLAAGFKSVGQDFPVFLHPQSGEEYALARVERKTAAGYRGFVVEATASVRLEDDLARRDLTINAMARSPQGELIDPFGGQQDLQARVLRHVGPAFVEDPVRILRLARFAARFADFSVAPATMALMAEMVAAGEVDALVPERVWQELARGLMAQKPSRMFEVLRACGALARLLPELDRLWGVPQPAQHHPEIDTGVHVMLVLDEAARSGEPLEVRWAALMHDLGKGTTPPESWPRHHGHEARSVELADAVAQRLRVPAEARRLASLVAREHGLVHRAAELRAETVLALIERCDGLRRPQRFRQLLAACACDARGRTGFEHRAYPQAQRFERALAAMQGVDAGAVAQAVRERAGTGTALAEPIRLALQQARLAAIVAAEAAGTEPAPLALAALATPSRPASGALCVPLTP